MSNFKQKSYDEIVALLQAKAIEFYSDKNWAGLAPFSLDDLLMRLAAEGSTLVGQYLDLRANQAYLSTATIYRDILRIAQNLGLSPGELSAASLTMQLTSSQDTTVPLGTSFTTQQGTTFTTTSELDLNVGNSWNGTVNAINRKLYNRLCACRWQYKRNHPTWFLYKCYPRPNTSPG